MEPSWKIIVGDCRQELAKLQAGSVHTCVTSPPYFGLRDYGSEGQIGLEPTPDEFVEALVQVFREVRRVLRDDGTVWLNLGDSYAGGGGFSPDSPSNQAGSKQTTQGGAIKGTIKPGNGIKAKDLIGIPWMVAFALRADGWYLRSDIIWAKPNPMPESVTDRPTRSHEHIFLLSKSARYFYDADAIREDTSPTSHAWTSRDENGSHEKYDAIATRGAFQTRASEYGAGRNKRDVWTVSTKPYAGAHFATFPPDLIEPCILAGAPEKACGAWIVEEVDALKESPAPRSVKIEATHGRSIRRGPGTTMSNDPAKRVSAAGRTLGFESSCECGDYGKRNSFSPADTVPGVVLDPFAGAGTTGLVAIRHNRSFVGVELNPEYAELARWRIRDDSPLFNGLLEAA